MSDFVIENGVLAEYTGSGGDVVIPEGVTMIQGMAFFECADLTSVTIPEGVTIIRNRAFEYCNNLKSAIIPDSVKYIGEFAFGGCTSLRDLYLGKGIKTVSDWVFYKCPADMRTIAPHIPLEEQKPDIKRGLARGFAVAVAQGHIISDAQREMYLRYIRGQRKKLYKYAAEEPVLMQLMIVEKIIPKADLQDVFNMVNSAAQPEISAMLLDYMNKSFKPGEIEKAEDKKLEEDFSGELSAANAKKSWKYETTENGTLRVLGYKGTETEVFIPRSIGGVSVTEIGRRAFSPQAERLTADVKAARKAIRTLYLTDSVTSIGEEAFQGCGDLTSVTIPESVTSIGGSAFFSCDKLTIHAPAGSYAEKYARENNIPFAAE